MIGYEDEYTKQIFQVRSNEQVPFYKDKKMYTRIHIDMNLNKRTYVRQVYTFLDWLGEWGGLRDALMLIGTLLLPLLQWKNLNDFLLSSVYRS